MRSDRDGTDIEEKSPAGTPALQRRAGDADRSDGVGFDDCSGFDGEADAEGGVADEEGGVVGGEHGGEVGRHFLKLRGDLPVAGAEDFGEGLGAAGAAVEGDGARLGDRDFGNEQEAADAAFGGDGEVGEDDEVIDALILDGGDDGDVDVACAQAARRIGRGR